MNDHEGGPADEWARVLQHSNARWLVLEVKPGRGLVLRDLLRGGEPVEVNERLGSESAVRWDRLAVRVLTIGGRHHLSGAVLDFPHEAADAVMRIFRESPARAKRMFADELSGLAEDEKRRVEEMLSDSTIVLGDAARVITGIWLAHTIKQLKAPPPSLTNFDGEQVVFTKVRFPVAQESRVEVTRLLDEAPELAPEPEKLCWSWHRQDGKEAPPKAESGLSLPSWD